MTKSKGTNTTNCTKDTDSSLPGQTKTSSTLKSDSVSPSLQSVQTTALGKSPVRSDSSKASSYTTKQPSSTTSNNFLNVTPTSSLLPTENIAESFEEFLEKFEAEGEESKYSALAQDLVTSGERVLNVWICDIKSYSMSLSKSIDLCYKKAFLQMCTALKNLINKRVDSEAASKDFLVKLVR